MIKKSTIKKYDALFSSGVEFAFKIHLCHPGKIEGASEEEIKAFEEKHNIECPAVMHSYMRHFGRQAQTRDTDYNCVYSLADFDAGIYQANLREEWHDNKTVKELLEAKNFRVNYEFDYTEEDEEEQNAPQLSRLLNINNVLVYAYDESARSFRFIDKTQENPTIFYFSNYSEVSSIFSNCTNKYREILFVYTLSSIPYKFAELGFVNGRKVPIGKPREIDTSGDFKYLTEYVDLYNSNNYYNWRILKQYRKEFYKINQEIEDRENKVKTIQEFENEFVNYLFTDSRHKYIINK